MLKRERERERERERVGYKKQWEATASIHPYYTTTVVSEFAVENLPLGRTEALEPKFAVKDLPFGRTHCLHAILLLYLHLCLNYKKIHL